MLDIDKITQINEKYIYHDGERLKMDDEQLFKIMVVAMELQNSYTQVIPVMRDEYERALQHLNEMRRIPEAKFYAGISPANMDDFGDFLKVVEYAGYVDGIRTALNTLYNRRQHCMKIFEQAKRVYDNL